jgi:hypothetical protein
MEGTIAAIPARARSILRIAHSIEAIEGACPLYERTSSTADSNTGRISAYRKSQGKRQLSPDFRALVDCGKWDRSFGVTGRLVGHSMLNCSATYAWLSSNDSKRPSASSSRTAKVGRQAMP